MLPSAQGPRAKQWKKETISWKRKRKERASLSPWILATNPRFHVDQRNEAKCKKKAKKEKCEALVIVCTKLTAFAPKEFYFRSCSEASRARTSWISDDSVIPRIRVSLPILSIVGSVAVLTKNSTRKIHFWVIPISLQYGCLRFLMVRPPSKGFEALAINSQYFLDDDRLFSSTKPRLCEWKEFVDDTDRSIDGVICWSVRTKDPVPVDRFFSRYSINVNRASVLDENASPASTQLTFM